MKIYAISGLGADRRVFNNIKDQLNLEIIDWLDPKPNESINSYAVRMAESINTKEKFCLLGVSYGGMIAIEMNSFLKPELTFLISSAQKSCELRKIYKILGALKVDKIIPKKLFIPPAFILLTLLGAKNKTLAKNIHADMDSYFTKWAVGQLIRWNSEKEYQNIYKIHGTKDLLIPVHKTKNTRIIEKGKHFMIADESEKVAQLINEILEENNLL